MLSFFGEHHVGVGLDLAYGAPPHLLCGLSAGQEVKLDAGNHQCLRCSLTLAVGLTEWRTPTLASVPQQAAIFISLDKTYQVRQNI